ncbi:MAG TPA: ATP synthase F0 subunit B [Candidatus Acidoferrales bacterium]
MRSFMICRNSNLGAGLRAFAVLIVGALLTALPLFAQEGGDAATDSPAGHAFRWINFAIVLGLLAFCMVKYAGPGFRSKANEISEKIAEGTRAREAAERQRQEIQAKVANLQNEIEQLRVQARRDAANEAQRLRDTGRAESEKIEQAARVEIEAAARAGRLELKALGARLSIQLAEAMLRQELTPQAETKLFRSFVAELGRNVN